jgi:hypothetical protein
MLTAPWKHLLLYAQAHPPVPRVLFCAGLECLLPKESYSGSNT